MNLATHRVELEFGLGSGATGPFPGEDIVALPGAPRSIAVWLANDCCSPRHEGVAVFDDGVARPGRTQDELPPI